MHENLEGADVSFFILSVTILHMERSRDRLKLLRWNMGTIILRKVRSTSFYSDLTFGWSFLCFFLRFSSHLLLHPKAFVSGLHRDRLERLSRAQG